MRAAFYITVDDRYFGIGLAQAKRLQRLWKLDVHLLVEGSGPATHDQQGNGGVFVHHNLMQDLIPKDLPSCQSWPRIVYGRIFAPFVLPQYDRLIFLDADIYPLHAVPKLLSLELPGGFAAVQDGATMVSRPQALSLTRDAWLLSIGINTQRYFNAGVMMFDHATWLKTDFRTALMVYMDKYGTSARMQDQDFLNHHFQDGWTELSPRFNYQKAHFNYGYEDIFPPALLHFSSAQKPWLRPDQADRVHGQFFPAYQKMFADAGIDHRDYLQKARTSTIGRLRTGLRHLASRMGYTTSKEKRLRHEWVVKSEAMFRAFQHDANSQRYADMGFSLDHMPAPDLSFDGRYLHRALNVTVNPA